MIKIFQQTPITRRYIAAALISFPILVCAGEPAGDRIYMGSFTDRDWSKENPCGDKVTHHWEWDSNEQWFGNTNAYFGKIFPEWFKPDGSHNYYNNWKVEVERIKAQGRIPYINWEAHGQTQDGQCWHGGNNGNARADRDVISEINSGQHDDLIVNLARGLRDEKTQVVMDLFHEMNGSWYDWSSVCKHNAGWEAWKNAFKRVVNIFRYEGASNVEFGSSVWFGENICGEGAIETVNNMLIPDYMDWIGIDVYGDVEGNTFSLLMDPWYNALAATDLPIVIGEMGVALPENDDEAKRQWMSEFHDALVNKYPRVKAFNWFDIDKGWVNNEANYHIESGNAGEHFNQLMSDPRFAGALGSVEVINMFNNECLSVEGSSIENSSNIKSSECKGDSNQIFTVTDLGNFRIELRALHSDKCLDVTAASTQNGANIQQYQCNATSAQIWIMSVHDWTTMEVELSADNTTKCLDLDLASGNVQQWQCHSNLNQRWLLRKTSNAALPPLPSTLNGQYQIKNSSSNECLDIAHAGSDNGSNLQVWSCNGSMAQRFSIIDLGNQLTNLRAGTNQNLCIDIENVSQENGANAHLWNCLGATNQSWQVEVNDWQTMEVTLRTKHSNKCLDKDTQSNNVQQWDCAGTANQKWFLEKLD